MIGILRDHSHPQTLAFGTCTCHKVLLDCGCEVVLDLQLPRHCPHSFLHLGEVEDALHLEVGVVDAHSHHRSYHVDSPGLDRLHVLDELGVGCCFWLPLTLKKVHELHVVVARCCCGVRGIVLHCVAEVHILHVGGDVHHCVVAAVHHHHVLLGALGEGLALGFLPQRHFGDGGCLHGVGAHCAQHEDLRDEVVEEEELDHVALGDLLEVLHDVDDDVRHYGYVGEVLDVPVPGSCDDGDLHC